MSISPPLFSSGLLLVILLVFCASVDSVEGVKSSPRGGPAFSDPGKLVEMDEQWIKKPVVHPSAAEGTDLVLSVDQHLYPAISPFIREFATRRRLKVSVHEGTCGISAGLLMRKHVDVGGFCCPAGENDRLPGLKFHTIGITGLAIIVHPANPVNNLDLEQVRDIFQGKILTWDEADSGMPKRPIRVIGRLHCKQRPGHWRLILDNEDQFSPAMIEVGSIK
ncbi:MAG: substrate-binding domain-containing protein, partial [Desulfobulbaceae bacterium]|nr:substrate-binding domain-containing protein [Desulfobulbaceae bacterium]